MFQNIVNIVITITTLISVIIYAFIIHNKKTYIIKNSYVLGTIVHIQIFGNRSEQLAEKALEKLRDIDDKMSVFKDYSEISKINRNAGLSPQIISSDTYFVIKKAVEYAELSGGSFDPTIGPLTSLWNIGTEHERIPQKDEIDKKLSLVNYKDIILDEGTRSIKLKYKNQSIDVGGIAKGFAADTVKGLLSKHHVKSALIDLGGNIFALGRKCSGDLWSIGIQNPFKHRGEYIGIVNVKDKSLVTSGNYQRYFMNSGKKFHHILDPKTGYPSESSIVSASIISDNSIDGDGLSTGIYIMDVHKSMDLIESLPGIDAILITNAKKVYITSGIVENFKLTDNEFKYIKNYEQERIC
ncbi:FAD:protein FMN transferase [Clostridium sp. MT-14]|uniref:FAD:protein FMN transferase n=1 Tax=Clostridium sp. MT-14 TaxID=3348360 RepID=UPI0035F29E87